MKKSRTSESDNLQAAHDELKEYFPESIPVLLVLALCLFTFHTLFNPLHSMHTGKFFPDTKGNRYVWISGLKSLADGLYSISAEQCEFSFPELLLPDDDRTEWPAGVKAFFYSGSQPVPTSIPPEVANIFFMPIPINRADSKILASLPGIGVVLADRIVRRREMSGPYTSKDELLAIKGIGPGKYGALVEQITLD